MDIISWLEKWYKDRCDGSWEHFYGVSIDTLDNPGWAVKIDLTDTPLEEKEFNPIFSQNGEWDWINCRVKDGKYAGAGDYEKLFKILEIFKEWAES